MVTGYCLIALYALITIVCVGGGIWIIVKESRDKTPKKILLSDHLKTLTNDQIKRAIADRIYEYQPYHCEEELTLLFREYERRRL